MNELLTAISPLIKRCLTAVLKAIASLAFGYTMYLCMSPIAYSERGYEAFGGEYILAIVSAIFAMLVLVKFLRKPSS